MFWASFGAILGHILAIFGKFCNVWANFGQNRAFSLADRFFPWRTVFLVRTVNFDCSANLSVVRLEMTTIRHDGRVYGSIRRGLTQPDPRYDIFLYWGYYMHTPSDSVVLVGHNLAQPNLTEPNPTCDVQIIKFFTFFGISVFWHTPSYLEVSCVPFFIILNQTGLKKCMI